MSLGLLILASVAYAAGGLFMKGSAGVTRLTPTLVFLALFVLGALAQARGMRDSDMSTAYVFVLGIEAIVAVLLAVSLLGESLTTSRVVAIACVVAGVAWLRAT
jgi:quaternary ammonium compound-resistance protein SugE